jgi:hypothetical protein
VEMTTPIALICKALFPSISTFETPPRCETIKCKSATRPAENWPPWSNDGTQISSLRKHPRRHESQILHAHDDGRWRWVRASPIERLRRRSKRRTPCDRCH